MSAAASPRVRPSSAEVGGNKAANLSRLDRLGLRVPPAIALGTGFCEEYFHRGGTLGPEFPQQLRGYVRQLEEATGLRLGGRHPLLVAVRSSPPISMPGMLDTVLNVGLTEPGVHGLLRMTGNPGLAWDAYRRLVRGFAETVLGAPTAAFDRLTARYLDRGERPGCARARPAGAPRPRPRERRRAARPDAHDRA